ncbi:SGNH/GDSL hydrolase family protein [Curtobacterium sp. VKM Ac-2865]|uniref:SGNH/GDSL hydrolase family protein n=1 Tax=Curtobacterium sp. VKM Ac-2865 TaxID=2783817 RepID=UPI00188D28E4|nr:SGNH/GDSL hydrolase family protein [Curtobacterium sp. VKM Ac-2865]MBF4583128.1 SGNH/GDSL hydrolase family protein [Curtobacterium sp. VKM Ac-2865]
MSRFRTVVVAVTLGVCIPLGAVGVAVAAHPALGSAEPSPTITGPRAGTSVVAIGDSIMAGYGLDDTTKAWPALLARADHVRVTNLGCSSGGFLAVGACGTDFAGLIGQATAAHPSIVIVQSTDNDIGQSAASIETATGATVRALHAALPKAQIVGMNTLWDQPGAVPAEVGQSTASLRRAVRAVHGTFVDIGQPLKGHAALLQDDSEHPTVAGHRVLVTTIVKDLRRAGVHL